jgi:hypothetical protein
MKDQFLTPTEIKKQFPNCPFSIYDLGRFVRCSLLKGSQKRDLTLVSVNSFKELIYFRNKILESEKVTF